MNAETIKGAYIFQYRYDLDRKRELAAVYTPEAVAEFIVNNTIDCYLSNNIVDYQKIKIIDPACGSGIFLICAIEYLLSKFEDKSDSLTNSDRINIVKDSIFGLDLDLNAVSECCRNISNHILVNPSKEEIEKLNSVLKGNFKIGNALDISPGPIQTGTFCWEDESNGFGRILKNGGFDVVIGNPPYRKIKNVTRKQKAFFAESIYGHINLYGLFIHLGIHLLKEHGFLGYITPQSMMSGLYFKNLRNYIRQHTKLHTLIAFESRTKVFDDVLQAVMIEILEKKRPEKEYTLKVGKFHDLKDFVETYRGKLFDAGFEEVFPQIDGYTFICIGTNKIDYHIFKKYFYANDAYALSSDKIGYKAVTGQIVWNRLKQYLSDGSNGSNLPLLKGNYVKRYNFSSNPKDEHIFLEVNKKTEQFIVDKPVIIIGRVTATEQKRRIIAAISKMDSPYFVENHYNIVDGKNPNVDARYLLAIINSKLTDYVFRKINGNTQVSATEINFLNIKRSSVEEEIVSLVEKINNKEIEQEKRVEIEDKIDDTIFDIYELSEEEKNQIKKFYWGKQNGRKI